MEIQDSDAKLREEFEANMEGIKREPAAEFRQMAAVMRQMFLALVDEGFTEEQAMEAAMSFMVTAMSRGDE